MDEADKGMRMIYTYIGLDRVYRYITPYSFHFYMLLPPIPIIPLPPLSRVRPQVERIGKQEGIGKPNAAEVPCHNVMQALASITGLRALPIILLVIIHTKRAEGRIDKGSSGVGSIETEYGI